VTAVGERPASGQRPRWRSAWRRRLHLIGDDPVLQAALVLVVLQLAFRAWATYGAWFIIDDFNFISRMGHDGLDPYTASRSYFGHVMPAAMYLSWLNHLLAPWNWALPATELLVMQAGADLALVYLLVTLFGRRYGILPPLTLFLFSAIAIEGAIWWAAAINLLPLEIALFMGLAGHVRYLRDGNPRHVVAANAWIVLGLLFNEKTALVYLAIAVFTLCYFAEGAGWARARSAIRNRRFALWVYGVTGAAHLVVYALVGRDFRYPNVFGYPTYEVVRNLVLQAYLTALVGGPVHWLQTTFDPFSFARPGDAVVLASVVAVGLILNELLRHRIGAGRALVLPGIFLAVDVVLLLTTRTKATGAGLVLDYRFQGEMAAVSAVALGAMAMPILGATASSRRRSDSELLDHPGRVTVVMSVIAAVSLYSTVQFVHHWHSDHRGRNWVETATHQLDAAPGPVPLVDSPVPVFVTNGLRYPENLQSRVLARQANADWVSVATDLLFVLDDTGRIKPAGIPATRRGDPGPVEGCGYRPGARPQTVELDGAVAYGGWWVRIGYLASGDSPIRLSAGDRTVSTTVHGGVHSLYFLGGGTFDSVRIAGLSHGVNLCTDDITVGRPIALDPEGAPQQ
jgi:hypothetical protein